MKGISQNLERPQDSDRDRDKENVVDMVVPDTKDTDYTASLCHPKCSEPDHNKQSDWSKFIVVLKEAI